MSLRETHPRRDTTGAQHVGAEADGHIATFSRQTGGHLIDVFTTIFEHYAGQAADINAIDPDVSEMASASRVDVVRAGDVHEPPQARQRRSRRRHLTGDARLVV